MEEGALSIHDALVPNGDLGQDSEAPYDIIITLKSEESILY